MNTKRENQGTQGGSHEQHVKAGEAKGRASHTCRGKECSSNEGQHSQGSKSSSSSRQSHGTQGGSHEQHVKAGEAGGSAHHTCRGRECSSKK